MQKESELVDRRQRKRDRIRDHFLEAAKEIILTSGTEGISVRNIADRAGYSYATLYNYFEDLNSLLFATKLEMVKDVFAWVQEAAHDIPEGLDGLKRSYDVYMTYFIDHPTVFPFLFGYNVTAPAKQETHSDSSIDEAMRTYFSRLVRVSELSEEDVATAYRLLVYVVHGLLALSYSGAPHLPMSVAFSEMHSMIDFIFKREV